MTANARTSFLVASISLILGIAAFTALVSLASAGPSAVAVQVAATSPPCLDDGVPLTNPPPTVLKPGWWARKVALARTLGKNTGGAPAVLVAGGLCARARRRWPHLRRGWTGKFTAGVYAATAWAAVTLTGGETWATALTGVLVALAIGTAWAAVPGEQDTSTAAAS